MCKSTFLVVFDTSHAHVHLHFRVSFFFSFFSFRLCLYTLVNVSLIDLHFGFRIRARIAKKHDDNSLGKKIANLSSFNVSFSCPFFNKFLFSILSIMFALIFFIRAIYNVISRQLRACISTFWNWLQSLSDIWPPCIEREKERQWSTSNNL